MTRTDHALHTLHSERLADGLWEAVEDGDIDQVQSLLDQGANPNHEIYWSEEWISEDDGGWIEKQPPLHAACANGNLEMAKVLIKRGADADKGDLTFNLTPLQRACLRQKKKVMEYQTKEVKCKVGEFITQSYINL